MTSLENPFISVELKIKSTFDSIRAQLNEREKNLLRQIEVIKFSKDARTTLDCEFEGEESILKMLSGYGE